MTASGDNGDAAEALEMAGIDSIGLFPEKSTLMKLRLLNSEA